MVPWIGEGPLVLVEEGAGVLHQSLDIPYVIKQSTPLEQLLKKEKSLSNLQEAPVRPICVH